MNTRLITTPSSALPGRPPRPFKYVHPITAQDGSVGYDHPLENYFDPTMAPRLLPSKPPSRLYDTVARAHDHRFGVSPDMVDPSWTTPRPLILNPRERRRSLAKLYSNSADYMGISPNQPEWRPRRSPYEDRRSTIGVAPNQVNMLVPYIPPIDTSLPPPSREWLDARAKKFLADAQADFEGSQCNANNDVTMDPSRSLVSDDSAFFEYDTDSTCDGPVTTVRRPSVPQPLQRPPQTEAETSTRDYDRGWSSDSDTDTDTDIDMYDGNPPCTPLTGPWIIPRKRPSVVMVDGSEVARNAGPPSSEDGQLGKRRRRGRKTTSSRRVAKKPKRHANDTPARQGGGKTVPVYYHHHYHHILDSETGGSPERARARSLPPPVPSSSSFGNGTTGTSRPPVSSVTAATAQMKQVRIASPCVASPQPQPHDSSVPPRSPKVFPCLLNGCDHICTSLGDLQRHQQSLRHSRPSHCCLACGKSYTRLDALKRHLNSKASCKKVHAAKQLENGEVVEEGLTEAN